MTTKPGMVHGRPTERAELYQVVAFAFEECACLGRMRISFPSLVIAIVCSLWAVRQPVVLRSVHPLGSMARLAVSA